MSELPERVARCRGCGTEIALPPGATEVVCPSCAAIISIGETTIRVEGTDAREVAAVSRQLASDQRDADRRAAATLRSPWLTGTFYVFVLIVIAAILLVAASLLPYWALPIVAVGCLLGVSIIGAFQLRHDDRLAEENFIELMRMTIKQIPQLSGAGGKSSE
jgi:LSD1 subclass zinc finger protein